MYCQQCGIQQSQTARFCSNCGAQLGSNSVSGVPASGTMLRPEQPQTQKSKGRGILKTVIGLILVCAVLGVIGNLTENDDNSSKQGVASQPTSVNGGSGATKTTPTPV